MKTIFSILVPLLLFVAMPACLYAENSEFEGFSLTATMKGGYCINSFSDTTIDNGGLAAEPAYSLAPMAELTGAYNWDTMFVGLSVLGIQPQRAESKYQRIRPYFIDQYMIAALFEFGLCNNATTWVYAATGGYAKTTYSEADHHLAFGFGPCYRSVKSSLPELTGNEIGWMISMRYQYLMFWDIGIEFGVRGYSDNVMYTKTVGAVELGIFYKII